jgi:F420-dependent oxidoreductase-like protein
MLELAIMIEGQNGLNWQRWMRIARAVEDFGFVGLYRSDHFTNANAPDMDSLELWVSLTWLADHTKRIEFGPLVTPVSFRNPIMTARQASAVDDLSGGRLTLGVGAGWQEREHTNYGWDLLDPRRRFKRFDEGLQIITHVLTSATPLTFDGEYYHLKDATILPRPQRHIPILIGGNGEKLTLPLAAKYASEWNATYQTPANYARLSAHLDELLRANGRKPSDVRRSMMTECVFGKDDKALREKLASRAQSFDQVRERGNIVGTSSQIVDQLGRLSDAGVQRVMLQWLDLDDIDGLEALASGVLPKFKNA